MSRQSKKNLIFIFIDGLGIGENNVSNPLHFFPLLSSISSLTHDAWFIDYYENHETRTFDFPDGRLILTDACLGIEGLPQSATGQATIFTGENCPQAIGFHKSGFPNEALVSIIKEKSLLKQLSERGYHVSAVNAYTDSYFEMVKQHPKIKYSVSTETILASDVEFNLIDDLNSGGAVFQDLTNKILYDREHLCPIISARSAGINLGHFSRSYDFCCFEYFQTDVSGHSQAYSRALKCFNDLEEFFKGLFQIISPKETTILITSDHGNVENLSTTSHTNHFVPTIVLTSNGEIKDYFENKIHDLTHITPAITGFFEETFEFMKI